MSTVLYDEPLMLINDNYIYIPHAAPSFCQVQNRVISTYNSSFLKIILCCYLLCESLSIVFVILLYVHHFSICLIRMYFFIVFFVIIVMYFVLILWMLNP